MKVFLNFFILLALFQTFAWSSKGLSSVYYQIEDSAEQKAQFIREIKVLAEKGNDEIAKEREFVINFFTKAMPDAFRGLGSQNIGHLIALRNKYKIDNLFDKEEFYKRIDVVPISLTLAQSALESGWGKSRFAREANNLFGHWTYSGVGLMPQNRSIGKSHLIRVFSSLQKSVNGYMLNLNTNDAYEAFREKRAKARMSNTSFGGIEASKTMINYSELKGEYIKMVQEMMVQNNLLNYDKSL